MPRTLPRMNGVYGVQPGLDVLLDRAGGRRAYAEGSVALLPGKFRDALADPSRRIRLDHLNRVGQGHIGGQAKQDMSMVGHAANFDYRQSMIAPYTGHHSPKLC